MPDSVKAFLSLGPKFCKVPLDIDRAQLERDFNTWERRLRLMEFFEGKEDSRTDEEKRFYLKKNWTPQAGRCPPLDMFIYKIRQNFDSWIPPVRIKSNMTVEELEGEKVVKNDNDHIYKYCSKNF